MVTLPSVTCWQQTWCSLYIVWYLVSLHKTVIYELSEQKSVYIIRSDGGMRIQRCPAAVCEIPEMGMMGSERAIHVYDASATANSEPAQSRAFLIVTSSRNSDNYRQTERRNMHKCVIPSYTMDELKNYSGYFGVGLEELATRCFQIGPSFRYVLTGNYAVAKENTEAKAQRVTAEQMDSYIENNRQSGDSKDISACLVKAIVREEEFEDPDDAYMDMNVIWEIASQSLCRIILKKSASEATKFVRNFITEVDSKGVTRLKGMCGNYFELILDDYLKRGRFKHCRTLTEPGATDVDQDCEVQLFKKRKQVSQRSFVDVPAALLACGTPDKDDELFSFCKSFPAVDFATAGFSVCFQATTANSHSINFDGISAVCEHVRRSFGDSFVVQLVFVVPNKKVFSKWRYTQSFIYTEEVVVKGLDDTEAVVATRNKQSEFAQLSSEMQARVSNLKQMVTYVYR